MMKKPILLLTFLSIVLLVRCSSPNTTTQIPVIPTSSQISQSPSQVASTPTAVFIPYVDANEFLEQANDRVRFKNWNFSLVLPTTDWTLDRFTGKNFSADMTAGTFVRNPLPNKEMSPAVTIIFNRIPNGLGVDEYSAALMQGKELYFENALGSFATGDKSMSLENAIGFITKYKEQGKDEESIAYFIYATNNDIGVQVIMAGDLKSMEEVQKELESIISSFQFEK
jgi:hypothetical protein